MNGRQDEVIFVEQRYAGLVAGSVGRVQSESGQKAFAGEVSRADLLELNEVGETRWRILMNALQERLVPPACEIKFGRPSRFGVMKLSQDLDQLSPSLAGAGISPSARIGLG